jgi:DNA-directed RNA polymerase specialized sigma24 family protein
MARSRVYKDPYSPREIKVLVEEYEELSGERSKAWIHVRLMDIDRAIAHLPPVEKEAVLLCGQLGYLFSTAGNLLGVTPSAMFKRYNRGLVYLVAYLNGGA